jgi:SpoVK/Ycf46/Vps4 family AAA+-type ATPase
MQHLLIKQGNLSKKKQNELVFMCNDVMAILHKLQEIMTEELRIKNLQFENVDTTLKMPPEYEKIADKKSDDYAAYDRVKRNLKCKVPKITFDEIIGQKKAIAKIKLKTIDINEFNDVPHPTIPGAYICNPEAESDGILLFGPPGNGKSTIAQAIAQSMKGAKYLEILASDIKGRYYGSSELTVKIIFEIASLNAPCVLFMDEVDSLLQGRDRMKQDGGSGESLMLEFLAQMSRAKGVLCIAATNCPWNIDEAFYRRLPPVYLTMPSFEDRYDFLKFELRKHHSRIFVEEMFEIAQKTKDFSFDDLRRLVKQAVTHCFMRYRQWPYWKWKTCRITGQQKITPCAADDTNCEETINANNCSNYPIIKPPILAFDVLEVLKKTKPTNDKRIIAFSDAFEKDRKTGVEKLQMRRKVNAQKELNKA